MTCDSAADVFQQHRDELGFVSRAQCEEKDLWVETRGGAVIGAALGNHCVRKPQTTLYELAVLPEYRNQGVASRLVARMLAESPHNKIVAKCPNDLPANSFYTRMGWTLTDTEPGKNRSLNVYSLTLESETEVYMTVRGGVKQAHAIVESAGSSGVETGQSHPIDKTPEFIDFPFTSETLGFEDHLSMVKEHEPDLTVAPDVEKGLSLSDAVSMADELAEYATTVVMVPKDCRPSEIPDRFRVGYTVGDFGSMANWPVYEYQNVGPVHLLGGSFNEQLTARDYVRVASMDSFIPGVRAKFGIWDGKAMDAPDDMGYYERLSTTLTNYWMEWNL